MKQIVPRIWQWTRFSEEKNIDFNGHLLAVGEHRIVVDPPPMAREELAECRRGGAIDYIVVTNRDHTRDVANLKNELGCLIFVPEADAAEMDVPADKTYKDGELLPGGIWAIHLKDQKSPGESALFLQQGKGVLILGDALLGKPPGSLSMLPPEKYRDAVKAREGLRRLLKYNFDTILVGDGVSIMTGAKGALERTLQT